MEVSLLRDTPRVSQQRYVKPLRCYPTAHRARSIEIHISQIVFNLFTKHKTAPDAFRPRGPRGKDLLAQLDIDRGSRNGLSNGSEEPPPFMRSQSAGSLLPFKPKARMPFSVRDAFSIFVLL